MAGLPRARPLDIRQCRSSHRGDGICRDRPGQLAYQTDTQTYWRLQTTAPTWIQDTTGGIIVKGTMTCTVTNISTAAKMPNTYQAVFTIGYQYLGRGPVTNSNYGAREAATGRNINRR